MTGARIVEGYSLTEAMMALCVNPVKGPNKLGSVGMPLPDVDVRIYDADEGTRILPPNELGEIAISAPQLMAGYWNRPEETAHVLRGTRRPGWHAPLAPHWRPRLPRRRRVPVHRRSHEGSDQNERLSGVAA